MAEYKETDVVVIGNGPSGISMSYLLSGWTPYYKPTRVPDDDLLHMRLCYEGECNRDVPLTEMNLQKLSDGLEGRTSNPVALVFDQLCHPFADIGLNIPSQLYWRKEEARAINHIVIGKESKPGGVWQNIQGDLKTLSRSSWMELPDFPFKQYLCDKSQGTSEDPMYRRGERASVIQVAKYYEEYVKLKGLTSNFMDNCLVTSLEQVPVATAQIVNEDTGEAEQGPSNSEYTWEVSVEKRGLSSTLADSDNAGHRNVPLQLIIRAKNVVLATGVSDVPNRMGVPGEHFSFVKHGITDVGNAFTSILGDRCCGRGEDSGYPVLVIGAGLSAADAILTASSKNLNVVHVFRETPCGNPSQMLKNLPKAIYPEYVKMFELMCGDVVTDWYKSYAQWSVHSFLEDNKVLLDNKEGDSEILEISLALVQIGSGPDLSFLPSQGTTLGIIPDMNIDVKHNPLAVNPFTNESTVERGLYALGPLVGDNFVRFIKGGAIAVTQHIQMQKGIVKSSISQ